MRLENPRHAAKIANCAAGIVVAELGTGSVTQEEMISCEQSCRACRLGTLVDRDGVINRKLENDYGRAYRA